MRLFSALLAFALVASPLLAADASLSVVRVWPAWQTADTLERIGDYFPGLKSTGDAVVLRSRAEPVDGYYFLLRLENPGPAIAGATFEISVIRPDSPRPTKHAFTAAVLPGTRLFKLGLTGADWPDREAQAVAWQIVVRDASGRELAAAKSFLWAAPSGDGKDKR